MSEPGTDHSKPGLSALGALVRKADPDRFLTALFAPAERREALFTLYAFNHETARAREVASEPMMAMIRLQWWREVVEGMPKKHEVATPLSQLLEAGELDPAPLLSMLDAREVSEFATVAEWRDWLLAGPGALAMAAAQLLGAPGAPGVCEAGAGYGAAGALRNTVPLAHAGICLLPADVLATHGLTAEAVISKPDPQILAPVFAALGAESRALLGQPRARGRALAAVLPAVLGRRDLRRPGMVRPRGLGDRLAVTAAATLGRA